MTILRTFVAPNRHKIALSNVGRGTYLPQGKKEFRNGGRHKGLTLDFPYLLYLGILKSGKRRAGLCNKIAKGDSP
jgi:hypothetical protein